MKANLKCCAALVLSLAFSTGNVFAEEVAENVIEKAADQASAEKVEAQMEEQMPASGEVQRRVRPEIPEKALLIYDPWEPMNRGIYNFNARFDRAIFLPTVKAYRAVTPDIVESGVTNFFSNLGEVNNFINNVFQLQLKSSGITLWRFVVNSTVGVAGLWDPASKFGLYEQQEDFGQTLGYWGVGSGPYLVLPFLGPSSLRDAAGLGVDYAVNTEVDLLNLNDDANKDDIRLGLGLLNVVDTRKNTAFRYYETGSPFEYELVRYAHGQLRDIQVEK
ncbi:MAG: VacJ family lipoprotein [Gammaproteobacteria bacterium]|nr:VacJ family lipoprotein [Gammaproteobacteria bacterium]MBQ0839419.1 VacJ family lipoprotein [Gammaproteobacteria bacterium]